MRRRIEQDRRTLRRSARIIMATAIGFAAFVAVFSRAYMAPYATLGGQVVLALVVAIFVTGMVWMRRLAEPRRHERFLSHDASTRRLAAARGGTMNPLSGGLTSAILLGAGLGFALWLLIAAVRPPAPDLARATRRWDRRRHSYAHSTGDTNWVQRSLGGRLTREASQRGWIAPTLSANLRLLDRSVEEHLVAKAIGAAAGFLAPTLLSAVAAALGVRLPIVPTLLVAIIGRGDRLRAA